MNVLMGLNAPWVGGTRIHALTLAEALLGRGHRLTLVTDEGMLEDEMTARGIPFARRAAGLKPMLELLLGLVARERPAVLHAHPAASILESYYLHKMTGIPFLVTMHGEYLMHFARNSLGEKIAEAVYAVIAVSGRVRDYLLNGSALPPDKIRVAPNGIDTNEFRPGLDVARLRSALGLQEDATAVLYLGRMDADKRQAILATVETIRHLARYGVNVRGVIVGAGDFFSALTEICRRVNQDTGREILTLTGFRRDLPALISLAEMVVATGRAALESMAIGKPVLAVGRAGFLGLVTPDRWGEARETNCGDHGVLPEPDPTAMADLLYYLHRDENLRQTLGIQMRGLVSEDYGIGKVAAEVESIYKEAAMNG